MKYQTRNRKINLSDAPLVATQADLDNYFQQTDAAPIDSTCKAEIKRIYQRVYDEKRSAMSQTEINYILYVQSRGGLPCGEPSTPDSKGIPSWVIWGGAAAVGAALIYVIATSKKSRKK